MAKKKEQLYKEAREMYLNTDLKLTEIAEQLGIKINTLYTISNREKWSLLKEETLKEVVSDRNIMLNDMKLKSLEFYEGIMNRCYRILNDEELFGKDLKVLTETHILAQDRYCLIAKDKLQEKTEENQTALGILEKLAKM